MLKKTNCSVPLADVNWDNFAPVKVKVFFWVFRHNNARHGVLAIDHCPFCLDASEDTDHLFFQCPRVAAFWTHVCHDAPPPSQHRRARGVRASPPWTAAQHLCPPPYLVIWIIWKSRNKMVFDSHDQDLSALTVVVVSHAHLWVVRAPRRLDCAPLDLWCSDVSL
jgi:hypothetical protein